MKKFLSIILAILTATVCSACGIFPLVKTEQEGKTAVASDGKEFYVVRYESGFPERRLSIYVYHNDELVCSCHGFLNGTGDCYDYENDLMENYHEIIYEYELNGRKTYQFNWGKIYTDDDGETFVGVPKHEY